KLYQTPRGTFCVVGFTSSKPLKLFLLLVQTGRRVATYQVCEQSGGFKVLPSEERHHSMSQLLYHHHIFDLPVSDSNPETGVRLLRPLDGDEAISFHCAAAWTLGDRVLCQKLFGGAPSGTFAAGKIWAEPLVKFSSLEELLVHYHQHELELTLNNSQRRMGLRLTTPCQLSEQVERNIKRYLGQQIEEETEELPGCGTRGGSVLIETKKLGPVTVQNESSTDLSLEPVPILQVKLSNSYQYKGPIDVKSSEYRCFDETFTVRRNPEMTFDSLEKLMLYSRLQQLAGAAGVAGLSGTACRRLLLRNVRETRRQVEARAIEQHPAGAVPGGCPSPLTGLGGAIKQSLHESVQRFETLHRDPVGHKQLRGHQARVCGQACLQPGCGDVEALHVGDPSSGESGGKRQRIGQNSLVIFVSIWRGNDHAVPVQVAVHLAGLVVRVHVWHEYLDRANCANLDPDLLPRQRVSHNVEQPVIKQPHPADLCQVPLNRGVQVELSLINCTPKQHGLDTADPARRRTGRQPFVDPGQKLGQRLNKGHGELFSKGWHTGGHAVVVHAASGLVKAEPGPHLSGNGSLLNSRHSVDVPDLGWLDLLQAGPRLLPAPQAEPDDEGADEAARLVLQGRLGLQLALHVGHPLDALAPDQGGDAAVARQPVVGGRHHLSSCSKRCIGRSIDEFEPLTDEPCGRVADCGGGGYLGWHGIGGGQAEASSLALSRSASSRCTASSMAEIQASACSASGQNSNSRWERQVTQNRLGAPSSNRRSTRQWCRGNTEQQLRQSRKFWAAPIWALQPDSDDECDRRAPQSGPSASSTFFIQGRISAGQTNQLHHSMQSVLAVHSSSAQQGRSGVTICDTDPAFKDVLRGSTTSPCSYNTAKLETVQGYCKHDNASVSFDELRKAFGRCRELTADQLKTRRIAMGHHVQAGEMRSRLPETGTRAKDTVNKIQIFLMSLRMTRCPVSGAVRVGRKCLLTANYLRREMRTMSMIECMTAPSHVLQLSAFNESSTGRQQLGGAAQRSLDSQQLLGALLRSHRVVDVPGNLGHLSNAALQCRIVRVASGGAAEQLAPVELHNLSQVAKHGSVSISWHEVLAQAQRRLKVAPRRVAKDGESAAVSALPASESASDCSRDRVVGVDARDCKKGISGRGFKGLKLGLNDSHSQVHIPPVTLYFGEFIRAGSAGQQALLYVAQSFDFISEQRCLPWGAERLEVSASMCSWLVRAASITWAPRSRLANSRQHRMSLRGGARNDYRKLAVDQRVQLKALNITVRQLLRLSHIRVGPCAPVPALRQRRRGSLDQRFEGGNLASQHFVLALQLDAALLNTVLGFLRASASSLSTDNPLEMLSSPLGRPGEAAEVPDGELRSAAGCSEASDLDTTSIERVRGLTAGRELFIGAAGLLPPLQLLLLLVRSSSDIINL
uniref:Tensin 2 n=1 Tax=Macrostomum lignano TaxID=282301 RepID=A0A1I8JF29_9PLAT